MKFKRLRIKRRSLYKNEHSLLGEVIFYLEDNKKMILRLESTFSYDGSALGFFLDNKYEDCLKGIRDKLFEEVEKLWVIWENKKDYLSKYFVEEDND